MIYLDNSATTNPKPNSVLASVGYAMKNFSYNSGRGGYSRSWPLKKYMMYVKK